MGYLNLTKVEEHFSEPSNEMKCGIIDIKM